MKRNVATIVLGAAALLAVLAPIVASAGTPNPNSAVIIERVFNDCPISTVTTTNSYPSSIVINDSNPACLGFANMHVWRFSTNGTSEVLFDNNTNFKFCADLTISGLGEAEAGLQIAPWWTEADGFLNVRTTDGEIACFAGRMPFYSFTSHFGLHYVKGTTIHCEITYLANGLSMASPGTIQYKLVYGGTPYDSGVLNFDQGNPAEDPPHGLWGILNEAKVGGHMKYFLDQSVQEPIRVEWSNICFQNLDVVPVQPTTWGAVKALFR